MIRQALFAGLVYDENGRLVDTAVVGNEANYVIDDAGFMRHISAEDVDRQVLDFFLQQLHENQDMAVEQAMKFMGKDDLMTKAAIDASLRNINMDDIIAQGIPQQAREMLGMMGFRVTINFHGEVISIDQPQGFEEE
ncbi:MAG: hypothetical protein HND44_17920 [Chloroflexi bacterium]|nr:hypothetical protein [Ardenticatenaceae bacterium]MBL1130334.1 hypothetical protein [Chloroflexota bacterium]NOG36425.1 hypothetical protein [Chloroflexota bacterium]GIK57811.1 MAG: hypothetical protein BroJett015_34740 [Chloroflexota bacterium]